MRLRGTGQVWLGSLLVLGVAAGLVFAQVTRVHGDEVKARSQPVPAQTSSIHQWTREALSYLVETGLLEQEEAQVDPHQATMLALVRAAQRIEQGDKLSAPVQAVLFQLLLNFADQMGTTLNTSGESFPMPMHTAGEGAEDQEGEEAGQRGPSFAGHRVFLHAEEEEHQLEWKGFIDYRFTNAQEEDGSSLSLPHVSLEIEGKVTPRNNIAVEIEWEGGGVEEGEDAGGAEIERARIDHQLSPNLKLRAGALIIPVGHLGMYHEPYEITGASEPILAEGVIPAAWSELGIGLVSRPSEKLRIIALLSQGLEDRITDEGLREALPSLGKEMFSGKATTLNLQFEPTPELTIGGSWYQTSFTQGGRLDHLSAYLQWERAGYRILAEFARANLSSDDPTVPSWMWGWYLQGEVPLPALSWREGTLPKLFARLGRVDTSSDPNIGRKRRLTLGLNFPLDEKLALKLEAQRTWSQESSPQNRWLASLVMLF